MNKEYTPEEAKAWLAGYDEGKRFAKKEWVGLTEEEINAAWGNNLSFARAIEAKLKEKNL
jgi:hypothetical protein